MRAQNIFPTSGIRLMGCMPPVPVNSTLDAYSLPSSELLYLFFYLFLYISAANCTPPRASALAEERQDKYILIK